MNIDYPYRFDNQGRTALAGDADHIRDLLEQLLFTDPGERVNRPDFGCGVRQLLFAPNRSQLEATLRTTIGASLQIWMGDLIDVLELDVISDEAVLTITIRYSIRATGEIRRDTIQRGA